MPPQTQVPQNSVQINNITDIDLLNAYLALAQDGVATTTNNFNQSQNTAKLAYNVQLIQKQSLVDLITARITALNNSAPTA